MIQNYNTKHNRALILKSCKTEASKRGGACLSATYRNARAPMRWKCDKGHAWNNSWYHIKKGQWCRKCSMKSAGEQKRSTIYEMKLLAKNNGGKCISRKYTNNSTKLLWECKNSHQFYMTPGGVHTGNWCKICSRAEIVRKAWERRKKSANEIIAGKKGKLISVESAENDYALISCDKLHSWRTTLTAIIYNGTWCPKCSLTAKLTIDDLVETAQKKQGRYLEKTVFKSHQKARWECKFGHIFASSVENVRQGKWCPVCGRMKKSIYSTKRIANIKGGDCLSEIYEGPDHHKRIAIFTCDKKHQWKMSAFDLRKGRWCPECTIIKMKKMI